MGGDHRDGRSADGLAPAFKTAVSATTPTVRRHKSSPPFSLRLTAEERARLEAEAGSEGLGAYIRSRLFDGAQTPRKRARRPSGDDQALAQVLGALGQSRIANNLNQMAKAANSGSFLLTPEGEASLRAACDAVTGMRRILMRALGLDDGERR